MPKPNTFPTLYDNVLQLDISKLREWGYLELHQIKSGKVTWSSTDWSGFKKETGNITIGVNTKDVCPYIELAYKFRDEPRNYRVMLVSMPSNLGKGKIWYFLCPNTNKRCRKLYLIDGYFLHREAFNGCLYESQTQTKKWRLIEKIYGCYFDSEKNYRELYNKHFKKFYNGKPTKRYSRIMNEIRKSERIPIEDIESLIIYGM